MQTDDAAVVAQGLTPSQVPSKSPQAEVSALPDGFIGSLGSRPLAVSVSVVIVSYNVRDLLRRAVRSALEGQSNLQVECVVVDNASHDGSADMVAAEFPSVTLIRSGRNLGFAAGVNQGIRRSSGSYVLLLNPDAEILDDGLARMAAFMQAHPRAAAVGPRLLYVDGTRQHAAFTFPTLPMILLDFFPVHGRLLDSRLNGRYPPADRPHPIDHLLGACMLIRRAALEDVGPLDEGFFMYCEEVDWCLRARKKGWQVFHLPAAAARHLSAGSTSQQRDAMLVELHRSRLRLYRKHYGRSFRVLARGITHLGLQAEERRVRDSAARGALATEVMSSRLAAIRQIRDLLRQDA